jgi:outer membrane protein assembly factor BamB
MGENLNKKSLAFGIISIFIFSSMVPLTVGINVKNCIVENYIFNNYYLSEISNFNQDIYYEPRTCDIIGLEKLINSEGETKPFDGLMDSAWPMKCHDNRHTSQSPYSTENNPGMEIWRFETDGWMEGGIVIDNNGLLYFGDFDYYLYALYSNNMTLKWRYKTSEWIRSTPSILNDGTIYIGSWDTRLYAINPDGTKKWSVGTGGSIASSPAIGEDGTIYIGNYGEKIVAINPNGTIKWYYNTGDDITSDPAIGEDGTIYIGSLDSYLYALFPNGTLKWRFKTGDRIYGSPSIAEDGTIYIGSSWDSYLYALYPNGTLNWKYKDTGTPNNPSIANDGTIYAGYLENLVALNPDGSLKWKFNIGNNRFIGKSAPAISADGTIYFGIHLGTPGNSNGGEIIAVNPDGTERWRKKIADYWVDSSPAIAEDGTVYIGSIYDMGTGYLFAFGNPDLQAIADGPYYGLINEPVQFSGSATGGAPPYYYNWDFGDGETSDEQNPTHIYTEVGEYDVVLNVLDDEGNISDDTTFTWIQETNLPPTIPDINGPISGKKGQTLNYDFISEEPDGTDMVWYYIKWGDGTNTGWIGPFDSGGKVIKSHQWSNEGTYVIRAKAKDVYDDESNWATLAVNIPRTRAWLRFFEMFPILHRMFDLWR